MYKSLAILLFCCLFSSTIHCNESYSPGWLAAKKRFAELENKAVTEEFVGLRTSTGIQPDLFPLTATGVSTQPIVNAAKHYLALLSAPELARTQFAVDDPEWRRWFNVDNGVYVRQGLSLKELSDEQRSAAQQLFSSSLSAKGLQLAKDIMKTDATLAELNQTGFLDEQLYFLTILGIPSETEPWGWQLDGHHLVINYFVLGDQVVMTPTFLGAEPAFAKTGKYAGNKVLQDEQNLALSFMQSLSKAQQQQALLASRKSGKNIVAAAAQDNLVLDYVGLQASQLNPQQQQALLQLIAQFVNNMREGHAVIRMEEVKQHLAQTRFAWVGDTSDDSVFYYRIHSPVILIEFDHQVPVGTNMINTPGVPTRDHIHVIIRTPNGNDYGKDLLSQHLAQHHH